MTALHLARAEAVGAPNDRSRANETPSGLGWKHARGRNYEWWLRRFEWNRRSSRLRNRRRWLVLPNRFNVSRGPQLPLLPDSTTAGCVSLHDGMPKQRDLQRAVMRLQLLRRAGVLLHGVICREHNRHRRNPGASITSGVINCDCHHLIPVPARNYRSTLGPLES